MAPDPEPRRFVLQANESATGAAVAEAQLRIRDIAKLRDTLRLEADDDPRLRASYEIGPDDLDALGMLSEPPFKPDPIFNTIVPWHAIREAPYLVHTGFELPLMLAGRKPLAVFTDAFPSDWFDEMLARFEPHVQAGTFCARIIDCPFEETNPLLARGFLGPRQAYFALPSEEWRIDAFIQLRETAVKTEWNESLERLEGSLLGYEDWQNDWWIERRRQSG